MGTRGFTGWKIDGKITLTYQQYDSYPSGVGMATVEGLTKRLGEIRDSLPDFGPELQESAAHVILGAQFKVIRTITEGQRLSKADKASLSEFHDPRVSTGEDNYSLLRHLQGDLVGMLDAKVALKQPTTWAHDSLFCEWGYLVNFSLPVPSLEVYKGFRTTRPTEGEWAGKNAPLENVFGPTPDGSGHVQGGQWGVVGKKRSEYFPVARVAVIPLSELTPDNLLTIAARFAEIEASDD